MAKGYDYGRENWWRNATQGPTYEDYLKRNRNNLHPDASWWEDHTTKTSWLGHHSRWGSQTSMSYDQADFRHRALVNNEAIRVAAGGTGGGGNAKGAQVKAKGKFGMGFGVWAGISSVGNMMSGDNPGTAVVKGFGEAMLWETAPLAMGAWQLASAAPQAISAGYNWARQRDMWYRNQHLPNFGGMYQDTQRALTMRQAGIQAIQGSKLNARSALGGEARILAQGMYRQNTV